MMRAEQFQSLVDQFKYRQPFQPFVIETDYGDRVRVDSPEELHCLHGSAVHTRKLDGRLTFVEHEYVHRVCDPQDADASQSNLPSVTPRDALEIKLEQYRRREPFKPFVIRLFSGSEVIINRPEELKYLWGSASHTNSDDGSWTLFEWYDVEAVADLVTQAT
jgi:hypothetical protein